MPLFVWIGALLIGGYFLFSSSAADESTRTAKAVSIAMAHETRPDRLFDFAGNLASSYPDYSAQLAGKAQGIITSQIPVGL